MVHSKRYHAEALDWEQTVADDSALTAAGVAVVTVTPAQIARDRAATVRRVEAAYLGAVARAFRPPVTAMQRQVVPIIREPPMKEPPAG